MKKQIVALVTAGIVTASLLAGCGSGSSTAESAGASSASGTSSAEIAASGSSSALETQSESKDGAYRIALIKQHNTDAYQVSVYEGAEAKAEELGVELTILDSEHDAATQISQIEQCTSEGYDAILFQPVDPDAGGDAAKAAVDKGIVVMNVIAPINDWESYGIAGLVCGNNVTAGEIEMQHVADLLDGKGNIGIITGPAGNSDAGQRMEGYENILKNYPDIKQVIDPAACDWDTAKAQSTAESWLSGYDLDAIICENDAMAIGAGNAAGAGSGIVVTGVGGTADAAEAISDGRLAGTVTLSGYQIAQDGIETAVKLIEGEELESNTVYVESEWIDQSNVEKLQ
ncbi:MAG: sugar ABC transporter substrate-binding protein [Eubacterium sp.]|nr:sugar ABC transporter substrate-binding protein [Eubacterium sp.]